MLVLFGSRARGDAWDGSDWDIAYRGNVNEQDLHAALIEAIGTERVDLVNMDGAGGLIRYRIARDGRCLFEGHPGAFEDFSIEAIGFWLDISDIVRREYDGVLSGLG